MRSVIRQVEEERFAGIASNKSETCVGLNIHAKPRIGDAFALARQISAIKAAVLPNLVGKRFAAK